MKLYIIRHGKTDWNNQKLIQGSTDLSLSDIGGNAEDEAGISFTMSFIGTATEVASA